MRGSSERLQPERFATSGVECVSILTYMYTRPCTVQLNDYNVSSIETVSIDI